jgi:hypothetical protein
MDEITLEGKKYFSSKKAAEVTGYSKDYVGQLCREGRVKARLVGRNWYVLEKSIQEHRFGKEETSAKSESLANDRFDTWEAASYSSESVVEHLPTLIFHEKEVERTSEINILEGRNPILSHEIKKVAQVKPEYVPVSEKLVTEMHSAWQDWFSSNPIETKQPEPIYKEGHDQTGEKMYEEETTPTTLEKIQESAEIEVPIFRSDAAAEEVQEKAPEYEENVPIQRSYAAPARYTPVANKPSMMPQQGRIIQERVVTRKKGASVLLRLLLLIVGLLAIGSAVIGTGHVSYFLEKYNLNVGPLQYLAGESSVN